MVRESKQQPRTVEEPRLKAQQLPPLSEAPRQVSAFKQRKIHLTLFSIGHHLETMNPKNQASMKARLFVKLQGKKMQDLSPTGVYHMLSACLTVVLAIDSPDMVFNY